MPSWRGSAPVLAVVAVAALLLLPCVVAGTDRFLGASATHPFEVQPVPHIPQSAPGQSPLHAALGTPPPENFSPIPVGLAPVGGTYDPANGFVYVLNSASNNVSVLNGTRVVATISVGSSPNQAVYDPQNRLVYVTNLYSANVSVVNGTSVSKTVSVGNEPYVPVYDGRNGFVYVVNAGSQNVSILNGTRVVGSVSVGGYPDAAAFDSANGYVYVVNSVSSNVSVINGTSLLGTASVGFSPAFAVADPVSGEVYIENQGTNNVTVLSGTSVVGTVWVGATPSTAVYDSADGYVYVANLYANNVSVINGLNLVASLDTGIQPSAMAFAPSTGNVYVVNSLSDNVTVIHGTAVDGNATVGSNPVAGVFDPGNGYLYVVNQLNDTVSVVLPWFPVTFSETGLAAGTTWSVQLGGSIETGRASPIVFSEPNGTYPYLLGRVPGYTTPIVNGSVSVNGSGVEVNVSWNPKLFSVDFTETGLPPGATWSVTLGGSRGSSSTATVGFAEPNGTYSFVIGSAGWRASPANGTVRISGSAVTQPIAFAAQTYTVEFQETGLDPGTTWGVQIGGAPHASSASQISVLLPNGSYPYSLEVAAGWTTSSYTGSLLVNGGAILVTVSWERATYAVDFVEAGLTLGASWSVALSGLVHSSSSATVSFLEPNGSYNYTISLPGWQVDPASGRIFVSGPSAPISVAFAVTTYSVTFREAGLPSGSSWSVTLGTDLESGSGPSISFQEPNGSYNFTTPAVAGFNVTPTHGAVTVAGRAATVLVQFTVVSSPSRGITAAPATFLGLPPSEGYALVGGILAGVALLVAALYPRRGRAADASDTEPVT